mgnify:CR=1 FL=1
MKKGILVITTLISISSVFSQNTINDKFGKGFNFTAKDSSFSMRAAMRIQNLFLVESPIVNDEVKFDQAASNFLVRRARLKFDGYAYSPKLEYKIELGLSNRDLAWNTDQTRNTPGVVMDAMLKWEFAKNFELWVGQTKLPSNRERVISSAALQLVDRSIVNSAYNIDRDMGLQLRHKTIIGGMIFKEIFAFSQGEGRNVTEGNMGGYAYTGRVEWLPMGEFQSKGDYVGSSIKREEKPKLALGLTYDYNDRAARERGQLGGYVYQRVSVSENDYHSLYSVMADMMFKYKGWSVMSEYVDKDATNGSVLKDTLGNSFTYRTGMGFNVQSGYMFDNNVEIAARYSVVEPRKDTKRADVRQYTLGVSKFFAGHDLKVQTDISYTEEKAQGGTVFYGNEIMFRLQIDLHF